MHDQTWQAEQFERNRARLRGVAYRMLGSLSDAEDAVQETWLRLSRSDDDSIDNIGGWLTTVVGRVCIDMLRARRARREDYVGAWSPEPLVEVDETQDGPEQAVLLDDSVTLALLVVLGALSPAERLAFVLHDLFAVPFEQIGPIVDRTPEAARKLASRARARVRGAPTVPDADLATQRRVVDAFLAAARGGDFDELMTVLDPEVVFRVDAGSRADLAPASVAGATEVARLVVTQGSRFAPHCRPALVGGAAGLVVRSHTGASAVVGITVVAGRIATIDLILDPDKLGRVLAGE